MRGRLRIVEAEESHLSLVLEFIGKLAEYEKLSREVIATEEALRRWLFGPNPAAEVVLAYLDGEAVGFALFFRNFSTFRAQPGIYLEDLFVDPAHRGFGIGKALLAHLAKLTTQRGYGRLEWAVLDWNQPAIDFYRRLGAEPMHDWTIFRVSGDALAVLSGESLEPHMRSPTPQRGPIQG